MAYIVGRLDPPINSDELMLCRSSGVLHRSATKRTLFPRDGYLDQDRVEPGPDPFVPGKVLTMSPE